MPDWDVEKIIALSKEYNIPEKKCLKFYFGIYHFLEDSAPQIFPNSHSLFDECYRLTKDWAEVYRREHNNR